MSFFLPYQRRWIEDRSRLKIMEKSRQIGMSWAAAYGAVRDCARRNARRDVWVSSRDAVQARLFLEDCQAFARALDAAAEDLGSDLVDATGRPSRFALKFSNGRRIHSLSSNADAQAGKRGMRILDEFALHPDPRRLYAIAYPGITWGSRMEIISTHRGRGNFFNQLIEEIRHKGNPKGFSLHTVTLEDALRDGFLTKLKENLPSSDSRQSMNNEEYLAFVRAGCADEESWLQEYHCIPSDDAAAFLPPTMTTACEYPDDTLWETDLNGLANPLYAGVDIGRDHDLTVIWVVEVAGDLLLTRRLICLAEMPFADQEAILYELLALPAMRRCCIDATGLGRQFAERATARFGRYKVEGITFTTATKEMLAYPARAAFEARTLRIPADPALRADLRAVRKETSLAGHIRFSADRGPHGHSDRFWALALAIHAAGGNATLGGSAAATMARIDIPRRSQTHRRRGVLL